MKLLALLLTAVLLSACASFNGEFIGEINIAEGPRLKQVINDVASLPSTSRLPDNSNRYLFAKDIVLRQCIYFYSFRHDPQNPGERAWFMSDYRKIGIIHAELIAGNKKDSADFFEDCRYQYDRIILSW